MKPELNVDELPPEESYDDRAARGDLIVDIADLEPHHCRAVIGDTARKHGWCGHERIAGTSYCKDHAARYLVPVQVAYPRAWRRSRRRVYARIALREDELVAYSHDADLAVQSPAGGEMHLRALGDVWLDPRRVQGVAMPRSPA